MRPAPLAGENTPSSVAAPVETFVWEGSESMASENMSLVGAAEPAVVVAGMAPVERPVRRAKYLYRVGSHAMLLIVEWFPRADGSVQRRGRFVPWPGL